MLKDERGGDNERKRVCWGGTRVVTASHSWLGVNGGPDWEGTEKLTARVSSQGLNGTAIKDYIEQESGTFWGALRADPGTAEWPIESAYLKQSTCSSSPYLSPCLLAVSRHGHGYVLSLLPPRGRCPP